MKFLSIAFVILTITSALASPINVKRDPQVSQATIKAFEPMAGQMVKSADAAVPVVVSKAAKSRKPLKILGYTGSALAVGGIAAGVGVGISSKNKDNETTIDQPNANGVEVVNDGEISNAANLESREFKW